MKLAPKRTRVLAPIALAAAFVPTPASAQEPSSPGAPVLSEPTGAAIPPAGSAEGGPNRSDGDAIAEGDAGAAPAAPNVPAAEPKATGDGEAEAGAEGDKSVTEVRVGGLRRAQTSGSVHVISQKQLERFAYDDPHQVLLTVPGVYVRGEDGIGLRPNIGMRGANSDRSKKITLMEDGVLFGPAPYSAPAAYYFPLIQRMHQVRVVKGPASIQYGPQTVGGAIDLVTAPIPTHRRGTADLGFGQYGYNKLHVTYGASDEQAGFLIEGMRLGTTGFKELDVVGGNTGFVRNEWMVKGRYIVDPSARVENELSVKVGYSDEESNETYLGLTDADARRTPYRRYITSQFDKMRWHRTMIHLSHRATFSPNLEMVTTLYRHDLDRIWRKVNRFDDASVADVLARPNDARNAVLYGILTGQVDTTSQAGTIYIGPNDRKLMSQGVQSHVRFNTKTGPVDHKIEYGIRLHYDEIRRYHTEDGFAMIDGRLVQNEQRTLVTADNLESSHALAMYATDSVTWKRLTVNPGVRIEAIQGRSEDRRASRLTGGLQRVLIPGIGAHYAVTRKLGVLAGVHKGFSPAPPGDARARPEESVNAEAGGRWTGKRLRAEVIGFYNAYSNLTNICTFSAGCVTEIDQQFDGGRARVFGVEAYGEAELRVTSTHVVPLRGAYTYTYSEFLSSFNSQDPQWGRVTRGDELPYVPIHQVSASSGIETADWGVTVGGTYVGSMRERAGSGTPAPEELTDDYFLLDASGRYRVYKSIFVYVNGRNLLDNAYIVSRRPFGARPGAPRWVQAGVRFDF
jgi:Fe(3+) dicitrate transport protein